MMNEEIQVPEGYKKTELGIIPEDWKVVELKECGKIVTGKTPPTSDKLLWDGDVPFITPGDIDHKKYVCNTKRFVSSEGANYVKNVLPKDSILVVCIGSTIGKVAMTSYDSITNQQINSILCKNHVNPSYVYYAISFRSNEIKVFSGTSAVPIVNKSQFSKFKISFPSIVEQQKIASILSKVDEQIEKTEQIIEKTELLKKGLMQKLLTKGIGHTRFKKTELGEIPEEWNILKLSKIFKNGPQNGLYKHKSHYGKGHKIVELKDLYKNNFYLDNSDLSLVELTDKEKLTYSLSENDVLINRVSKQIEGVAKALLVKNIKSVIVFESNMMRASLNESLIIPEFFLHFTNSDFYRMQVNNFVKTGNQSSISQGDLNNIKIFITTIEEQQKIASILSKVDSQIQDNQNYLTKLQEIKKGLMQDLLTGKVRVCV